MNLRQNALSYLVREFLYILPFISIPADMYDTRRATELPLIFESLRRFDSSGILRRF